MKNKMVNAIGFNITFCTVASKQSDHVIVISQISTNVNLLTSKINTD